MINDKITEIEKNFQAGNYPIDETLTRPEKPIILDNSIVDKITALFNQVNGKTNIEESKSGHRIDTKKYYNYKAGHTFDLNFFESQEEIQGLTLGILVDVSTSMMYDIDTVRNLIASFYKGLERANNIKLIVYLYTAHYHKPLNLCLTEIKSLEDCKKITMVNDWQAFGTPTFLAIDTITKRLRKLAQSTQTKTALMILTDGYPEANDYNGNKLSIDETQKLTYRAVTKAQNNDISTFCVSVRIHDPTKTLYNMFKGHLIQVTNIREASKVLSSKLYNFIEELNKK